VADALYLRVRRVGSGEHDSQRKADSEVSRKTSALNILATDSLLSSPSLMLRIVGYRNTVENRNILFLIRIDNVHAENCINYFFTSPISNENRNVLNILVLFTTRIDFKRPQIFA
jgi:hypothetical protein